MCQIAFILAALLAAGSARAADEARPVSGTFIQLNRQTTTYSTEQWQGLLTRMSKVGIATLIVQWTAEPPVLYFRDQDLDFREKYDAVERLLAAASNRNFSIFLGLQSDPAFWKEITARDKPLRDYFLLRQAQNERLQAALLKAFGPRQDWVGYYIPDEIDDFSWRDAARRKLLADYLRATTRSLREHDPKRSIAISAFFRTRTAPRIFTGTLSALAAETKVDYLLLQDGAGHGDPPDDVLPIYYQSLLSARGERGPELWAVLEAFRQTSRGAEPFAAKPAPADAFDRQIRAAAGFKRRVIFAFPDYVDPKRGPEAQALYRSLAEPP
jgi:hypothetical protein